MISLKFPEPSFKIKEDGGKRFIFDSLRKSWLHLTEEEWVRQHIISYLIEAMNYPSSLIALEKEIILNGLKKRFDILVYNREHKPWLMVECKSPKVSLNKDVLMQALRYNMSMPVSYIIISNGDYTIGWRRNEKGLEEINNLPEIE